MANSYRKNLKIYNNNAALRISKIDKQIAIDVDHNPLLKLYDKLDDYYKEWILDSKLVATIPALPIDDKRSQSYFASGEVSAVFMYENNPYDENDKKRFFLFDSEDSKLFSYEKKPHSQEHHIVKKPNFDEKIKYYNDNPIVLFFLGCDDGHVGKRFKTKNDAMEFLQLLDVFEDVFEFPLEHHN